jgi:hypothetical protein
MPGSATLAACCNVSSRVLLGSRRPSLGSKPVGCWRPSAVPRGSPALRRSRRCASAFSYCFDEVAEPRHSPRAAAACGRGWRRIYRYPECGENAGWCDAVGACTREDAGEFVWSVARRCDDVGAQGGCRVSALVVTATHLSDSVVHVPRSVVSFGLGPALWSCVLPGCRPADSAGADGRGPGPAGRFAEMACRVMPSRVSAMGMRALRFRPAGVIRVVAPFVEMAEPGRSYPGG